jgi:hypothetical protein
MAPFLRLLLPRAGAVPPNAAIALEGHVLGAMEVTARVGETQMSVVVERAWRLEYEPFGGAVTFFFVRPTNGAWPARSTVVITAVRDGERPEGFEVPIDTPHDVTAPVFSSLTAPAARTLSHPRGHTDVIAVDHGPFDEVASPVVLVTLELGAAVHTGVVLEGRSGTLTLRPGAGLPHVDALTLTDLAGNARRIEAPCE